jgi:hypothetical protein
MGLPLADILQDRDFPVLSVGVYTHFNDIVFYAPSERIRTERVNKLLQAESVAKCHNTKYLSYWFPMKILVKTQQLSQRVNTHSILKSTDVYILLRECVVFVMWSGCCG